MVQRWTMEISPGDVSSRAVFLTCLHAQDARHFGRYGPEGQFGWVLLVTILHALCSLLVFTPMMLGIMADMTQVDCCIEEYRKIGLFWEMTSFVSVFGSLVRQWIHVHVSLQVAWSMVQTAENCGNSAVAVLRWSSIFPVVVQRPFPMTADPSVAVLLPLPLVSSSHLCGFRCSPLEYKIMEFSGCLLQVWFPFAALLGLTVDTCLASVHEAFWKNHMFYS